MNRFHYAFVLIFLFATIPTLSSADVACSKLGSGVPQTWDCKESVQISTIQYGWSVQPSYLGFFANQYYDPAANPNYNKLMQCHPQENVVIEVENNAENEIRRVRYDGTVKVVRQYGANIGPLSQRVSEGTVYCDSPGPTLLAQIDFGDDEGIGGEVIDPVQDVIDILSSIPTVFCGGGGPSDIEYGIGTVTIYCRGQAPGTY